MSVWKLLGELCTFSRNIGPSDVVTLKSNKLSTEDCLGVEKNINGLGFGFPLPSYTPLLDILKRGEKAYKKILKASLLDSKTPSAIIYFDIGCSLYSQGIVELQSTGQGSGILSCFSESKMKSEISQLFAKAKNYFIRGKSAIRELIYNYWCIYLFTYLFIYLFSCYSIFIFLSINLLFSLYSNNFYFLFYFYILRTFFSFVVGCECIKLYSH